MDVNLLTPSWVLWFDFKSQTFKCAVVITCTSISNAIAVGPHLWQVNIGLGNGLVAIWLQAITCVNVDLDLCCHMVSLNHSELRFQKWLQIANEVEVAK